MTDVSQNTVPGQGYGEQAEQKRQLAAVPMAPQPRTPPPALNAPTARPNEPVQAGLGVGPGPGREALGGDPGRLTRATLQAIVRNYPSPTLERMLMELEN